MFTFKKALHALLTNGSPAVPVDTVAGASTGVNPTKRSEPSLALSDDYGVGFGAPRPSMNIHHTAYDRHIVRMVVITSLAAQNETSDR